MSKRARVKSEIAKERIPNPVSNLEIISEFVMELNLIIITVIPIYYNCNTYLWFSTTPFSSLLFPSQNWQLERNLFVSWISIPLSLSLSADSQPFLLATAMANLCTILTQVDTKANIIIDIWGQNNNKTVDTVCKNVLMLAEVNNCNGSCVYRKSSKLLARNLRVAIVKIRQ